MNAYTDRHLLWTDREQQAALRFLAHQNEDDPTLEAPETTDADEPEDADAPVEPSLPTPDFAPQTCQCGAMSIKGGTAEEVTRDWVAMDRKDHHLGRPCGTKLLVML